MIASIVGPLLPKTNGTTDVIITYRTIDCALELFLGPQIGCRLLASQKKFD